MLRHIVMFSWKEGVSAKDVIDVSAALDEMAQQISSIRTFLHGSDLGISAGNCDYVVCADFDDLEGYENYRDHPQHQSVVANVIAPRMSSRNAVQVSVEP